MLLLKGGKRRMRAWEAMNVDVSVSVCVEARRIFFDDVDLGLAKAAVKKIFRSALPLNLSKPNRV